MTPSERFILRPSGNIGQELISPKGKILAWTTDAVFGTFLVRILNEYRAAPETAAAIYEEENGN